MIFGSHILLYSRNADADRAFLREVLELPTVDIGHGWLIFEMPPAECAVHPADASIHGGSHAGHAMIGAVVYFMCDDVEAEVKRLAARGVRCAELQRAEWGISTAIPLPGGESVGLYQPLHAIAIQRANTSRRRRSVRKKKPTKKAMPAAAAKRRRRRRPNR